jgi:hypothetical protein
MRLTLGLAGVDVSNRFWIDPVIDEVLRCCNES